MTGAVESREWPGEQTPQNIVHTFQPGAHSHADSLVAPGLETVLRGHSWHCPLALLQSVPYAH